MTKSKSKKAAKKSAVTTTAVSNLDLIKVGIFAAMCVLVGIAAGKSNAYSRGYIDGRSKGYSDGYQEGETAGYSDGVIESVLHMSDKDNPDYFRAGGIINERFNIVAETEGDEE